MAGRVGPLSPARGADPGVADGTLADLTKDTTIQGPSRAMQPASPGSIVRVFTRRLDDADTKGRSQRTI
jgi:hypothetical protein